jgi:DNA-binding CsgD family transcriptional regulator/tetratricopeptide (TPR) repeat protein
MRARLSSRRFIGREGELAELELAAREAGSGRPGLVLLGGDSGVGKTRLIGELASRLRPGSEGTDRPADGDPPLVLRGDAVQASDGELPYAALLGALRPLVRARDPAFAQLPDVTRVQLATLLPGLQDTPPPVREGPGESDGSARLALFEALLALLEGLSERAPLVLILEDMHWADRSTLAFVAFLMRSLRDERILVVLSYRTDELYRRHPLRPLLSELERAEGARRIMLEPFDRDELAEALADILGAPPEPVLLTRLLERGEGNALYTEELLAAGLDGRGAPPRSLSDAFLGRIERLSPDAQRVARALALGRALDEAGLAAITGLDDGALREALREAVSEQVLVPVAVERFGFRHALLGEVLYDDLLPGERAALHAALARRLEEEAARSGEDDDERLARSASIAFHHSAAGDQPAALRTSVVAADAATCARAFEQAADLYEHALALWSRVSDPGALVGIDHAALLWRAAVTQATLDARSRAETLLREALGELDTDAEPARYAKYLLRLGTMLWSLNRGDDAIAAGREALGLLGEGDPERPQVRGWLARLQLLRGRFRDARAEAEAALTDARAVGNQHAVAELLDTRGMALTALGEIEAGIGSLRESIDLARRSDDIERYATSYANLADMLLFAGRAPEALQVAQEGLELTPSEHVRAHGWLTLVLSEVAFACGDWALARSSLSPMPKALSGNFYIFRMLRVAELAMGVGEEERAAEALERIAEPVSASSESQWIGVYGALTADLFARRGDLPEAQHAVAEALDRMEVCTEDIGRISRVSLSGIIVEADRAQRARDLGDTAARRDALARARLHLGRLEACAQDGGPQETARATHGRAEMARARGRGAANAYARAARAWGAIDVPYPAAVATWRRAECLAEGGDREGATAAAAEALEGARRLGSLWLEREVRGLGERARLGLADDLDGDGAPRRPGAAEPAPAEDPFGLTDRERQVLSLLAEGATNRQIGAALYMAEKTASVHVSRILAKLDVRGRTEAAAVAHRLHLAAPPGTVARR